MSGRRPYIGAIRRSGQFDVIDGTYEAVSQDPYVARDLMAPFGLPLPAHSQVLIASLVWRAACPSIRSRPFPGL